MDLQKIIRSLVEERSRLDSVIAALEAFEGGKAGTGEKGTIPKRRGRKSMSIEERRRVSERMRQYWENQHQAPAPPTAPMPPA